jgi:hypothetical protein
VAELILIEAVIPGPEPEPSIRMQRHVLNKVPGSPPRNDDFKK